MARVQSTVSVFILFQTLFLWKKLYSNFMEADISAATPSSGSM